MYYRLLRDGPIGFMRPLANKDEPLMGGAIVDVDDLELPWRFRLDSFPEGGRLSDSYLHVHVMSPRLIEAIRAAGVDNLQILPAEIVVGETGRVVRDFSVVNVIGLVSCADEKASKGHPLAAVKFFEKLIIDPSRAGGLLMFRLAESLTDVIVAEKIAKVIVQGGFQGLTVEPVVPVDE